MGDQVKSYHPIVFVTGTGRSGTNITKQLFANHPEIATLPFEHRFTIDPRGVIDFYRSYPQQWSPYWSDYKVKDFIGFLRALGQVSEDKRLRTETSKEKDDTGLKLTPPSYAGWALEKWFPGYLKAVDNLEQQLVDFDYSGRWPGSTEGAKDNRMQFTPPLQKDALGDILRRFLNDLTGFVLKKQQRSIFLEDNTHSLLYASSLFELYPNAKLIHVVRDPRDVLASLKEQKWCPSELNQLIVWYQSVMQVWEKEKSLLKDGSWIEIRMEDLVLNPSEITRDLSKFIGIDQKMNIGSIDLSKHHSGRYKTSFSQIDIDSLNSLLARYLEQYTYPLT